MQDYLPACKFVTTHGVRGELKALPLCDGAEFLAHLKQLYPSPQGGPSVPLRSVRGQSSTLIVRLGGVDDMDAARALVGRTFYFAKAEAKLPKGRYFIDDLLGCTVQDADTGAVYGTVTAVDHPAAQDVYTVSTCFRPCRNFCAASTSKAASSPSRPSPACSMSRPTATRAEPCASTS